MLGAAGSTCTATTAPDPSGRPVLQGIRSLQESGHRIPQTLASRPCSLTKPSSRSTSCRERQGAHTEFCSTVFLTWFESLTQSQSLSYYFFTLFDSLTQSQPLSTFSLLMHPVALGQEAGGSEQRVPRDLQLCIFA